MAVEDCRFSCFSAGAKIGDGSGGEGRSSGAGVGRGGVPCVSAGQFHYTVARFAPTVRVMSLQFAIDRFQAGD